MSEVMNVGVMNVGQSEDICIKHPTLKKLDVLQLSHDWI